MNRILMVLFLCFFILGCASKNDRWYLHGKTQTQFNQDCRFCKNQAYSGTDNYSYESGKAIGTGAASGSGALAAVGALSLLFQVSIAESRFRNCLKERGYTKAK